MSFNIQIKPLGDSWTSFKCRNTESTWEKWFIVDPFLSNDEQVYISNIFLLFAILSIKCVHFSVNVTHYICYFSADSKCNPLYMLLLSKCNPLYLLVLSK